MTASPLAGLARKKPGLFGRPLSLAESVLQAWPALSRAVQYLRQAPPDLPRALQLEWQFVTARWLGIVFVAPALLLWNLPADRLLAAYLVLLVAGLYNFAVQRLMRPHAALFASGYVTILGDGLLVVAMLYLGGGFSSPFHYILFTAAVSGAMRFGRGPALAMAASFSLFDALESLYRNQSLDATFAFRTSFLCLTAIYAGYLRGQAQQAEEALEQRLRQANLLNEATAKLGASLEFKPVLRTIVDATSHLFGSKCVVLRTSVEDEVPGDPTSTLEEPVVIYGGEEDRAGVHMAALLRLCERHGEAEIWRGGARTKIEHEMLPAGEAAIVLSLASPSRQISLATLAVTVEPGRMSPLVDSQTCDSFAERITLALENASLYRTLASRTNDLQRAYADLAMAHQDLLSVDEMKTNFIANVSHELRTPLSSIRAFSELLLSYEDDPTVQKEFVGIINTESERLTRLVNDVLDISKIEAGRMDWHMATLDVASVVRDSARTYAPLVEMHKLSFETEIDPGLPATYGDRDRLQQVLGNLLNNAVKFTPAGGITLRAQHVGDEIRISVRDTGIGIPAQDQERIFEKFQQVGEMLTDKPGGTGLGLAICREIVTHHEGRLWVESEPGQGSTFSVALKAAPSVAESASPPAGAPPAGDAAAAGPVGAWV